MVFISTVAFISTSCVSTFSHKANDKTASEVRGLAGGIEPEVAVIAAQGENYKFDQKNNRGKRFTEGEVAKLSTAKLKLIEGQLLQDNDAAFDRKLEMIQKATQEIRMVYFIYANDDSSSVLNKALIEKAQKGVKVKLLVDFITNYKSLDLFQMLEKEGKGNIKTYFYNFPNEQLIQDANYMTLPCPTPAVSAKPSHDDCYNSKMAVLRKMQNSKSPTAFAKIFLSGLYGKNATAIKIAMAYGAQIDPAKYKPAPRSPEQAQADKEDLFEFVQLVSDAFIGDSIVAKIKLSMAMVSNGDVLNPLINEVTGRLPVRATQPNKGTSQLWDHLSDYTHHKLLTIDGEEFILGGRNIEDSYHMKERVGSKGKYIFVDTDFWGKTARGGVSQIEKSYDNILKTSMVVGLNKVLEILPPDLIANTTAVSADGFSSAEMSVGVCLAPENASMLDVTGLGDCILNTLLKMPGYKSIDERIKIEVANMNSSIERYNAKYVAEGKKVIEHHGLGQMSARDLERAQVHYLENTNYKKSTAQRIIGSKVGSEALNNKNIHAAWYSALENVCVVSRKEDRRMHVIIHTAYLLMPSGMIHRIAKMLNNDYGDCSKVKITFITNSPETTDLGPINLLARYQLGVLFDHYTALVQYEKSGTFSKSVTGETRVKLNYTRFFPTIEYYEFQKTQKTSGNGKSLHTKLSLIGDDLIIGSANADVRSYYMDTNNALMIRNAYDLNDKYRDHIELLITDELIQDRFSQFVGKTPAALRAGNAEMLDIMAKRWHQEARLTPARKTTILNTLDKIGAKVVTSTKKILTFRDEFGLNTDGTEVSERFRKNNELNILANEFDAAFKVF